MTVSSSPAANSPKPTIAPKSAIAGASSTIHPGKVNRTYNAASEALYVPLPTLSSSRTSAIKLNAETRITRISP